MLAKAFADAEGDERKSEALYLKFRVSQLRRELATAVAVRENVPPSLATPLSGSSRVDALFKNANVPVQSANNSGPGAMTILLLLFFAFLIIFTLIILPYIITPTD